MNKKRIRLVLIFMILMNIGTALVMSHQKNKKKPFPQDLLLGNWSGILDTGLMKMNTVLHVQNNTEGELYATWDNLSTKSFGIPIDAITFKDNHLDFELQNASAIFEGELLPDKTHISGKILQNGQEFSLNLEKGFQAIKAHKRPQQLALPFQEP